MKEIEFVKAEACGNDFIIIDRLQVRGCRGSTGLQPAKLAKELCQRKLSVGADGLLLIEASKRADFKMRVFNPDGSEVDMCGNGSRCAALYAHQKKPACGGKMVIETRAGDLQAEVKQDKVKIKLSRPKDLRLKFDLDIDGQTQNVSYINTGVPHIVCFAQDLDNFNVEEAGRAIRYHPEFQPGGTNADFVQVLDEGHIRVRTYERGVEQETLACGTGCVAAGIITAYQTEKPQKVHKIKVDTRGGEALNVYFNIEKDIIDEVFLEGQAKIVYRGGLYV
ncbi:MAG: diaminopimelate epimerase [Candidatus Omnitrophica bacterium]|nr:diaminopimelate epimerase [Candidatus Omnitrophota bacterium]MBU3933630.1 diaminopimelate epimerase [Candidatus Omnitrophota bacterium]